MRGLLRVVRSRGVIHLDNNATTRPLPEAMAGCQRVLAEHWHNPSSVHRAGQMARREVELAREALAALVGGKPKDVTLTGGGTEAIDLALRGTLEATGKRVIVTTAVEHAAVRDLTTALAKAGGAEVRLVPLDRRGLVRLDALEKLLTPEVAVVSVQWANNETGVVQPVREIGERCRAAGDDGVVFHCDGTQWVGKMPVVGEGRELASWCDLLTFSPHKFHGPKGVGVLWARAGTRLVPRLHGAQEKGRRAGTENVPGIAGAGEAARSAMAWLTNATERTRLGALRDGFERAVLGACPGAVVNGAGVPRLWNTSNIAFPRLEAEALLMAMSERGLMASAGAACSSGSLDPSPVLLAMGIAPELAGGSIRFSLSRFSTREELADAARIVGEVVGRLRASMPG